MAPSPSRGNPPFTLDQVVDHFAQWRSTRPKKGKTPPFLIDEALALIDDYPITAVASTLRMNGGDLQKRRRAAGHSTARTAVVSSTFVEARIESAPFTGCVAESRVLNVSVTVQRHDGACLQMGWGESDAQAMAKKMHTSRVALNRLLDEADTSVTLTTLARAASVLGKKISFQLEDAA